jgi:glycosyltransferase involved in cell wall biosynthesis
MINIHLYPSSFAQESRIDKQSKTIKKLNIFSKIYLIGTVGEKHDSFQKVDESIFIKLLGIQNKNLGFFYKLVVFICWYITVIFFSISKPVSCVNAHSLSALPLGFFLKLIHKSVLIYDTHELETETHNLKGLRKLFCKKIEKFFIKYVDHIFVVSESISEWYKLEYDIKPPSVVINSPLQQKVLKKDLFRSQFNIRNDQLIFIYQGYFGTGRGLEVLLNSFAGKKEDSEVLVFMGDGDLKDKIELFAKNNNNIFYKEFVPIEIVQDYTSSADIGIALIENTCLSYKYALPNKLFEYSMAGLPVIISNLPEMKNIVNKYRSGVVVNGDTSLDLNNAIKKLLSGNLNDYKNNAKRMALELSWENQELVMLSTYNKINFKKGKY